MERDQRDRIRESRLLLGNQYAYLDGDGGFSAAGDSAAEIDEKEYGNPYRFASRDDDVAGAVVNADTDTPLIAISEITSGRYSGRGYSRNEAERMALALLRKMWSVRGKILSGEQEISPSSLADPVIALRCIGYVVELEESLGQFQNHGGVAEVAGIINTDEKSVRLSRRFSLPIRNFTAAHELGHAVMHEGRGLHRDRALDGASTFSRRDRQEAEADWFATNFLMPAKQVRLEFQTRFFSVPLVLNDDSAFALGYQNDDQLRESVRTIRDYSKLLATAQTFNGSHIVSMAEQFGVSVEAMAIRLEELNLASL